MEFRSEGSRRSRIAEAVAAREAGSRKSAAPTHNPEPECSPRSVAGIHCAAACGPSQDAAGGRRLDSRVEAGWLSDSSAHRAKAGESNGATAYADAVATYLAFAVSKCSTRSCTLAIWEPGMGRLAGAMGRQALPMQWSFAETNPLAGAGGDIAGTAVSVAENLQVLGGASFFPEA